MLEELSSVPWQQRRKILSRLESEQGEDPLTKVRAKVRATPDEKALGVLTMLVLPPRHLQAYILHQVISPLSPFNPSCPAHLAMQESDVFPSYAALVVLILTDASPSQLSDLLHAYTLSLRPHSALRN